MHRRLLLPACVTVALAFSFATAAAQTSMPAPTQVPASTFPSIPAPTSSQKPQPAPQQPATIDPLRQPIAPPSIPATPPATPDPLTQPIAPPTPSGPSTPYRDPLETPIIAPTASAPSAPPAQAIPVTMAPPATVASLPSRPQYALPEAEDDRPDHLGSTYIPVDSPIYPMALRLYSLGYLDTAFINMRPWTRRTLLHALEETRDDVTYADNQQAQEIVANLLEQLSAETPGKGFARGRVFGTESVYTRLLGVSGTSLRDSYHLGQTINNDYGRPNATGFNNITGFSSVNEMGRFSLYVRGEFQHAPAEPGYSLALASQLSCIDFHCSFNAPDDLQAIQPYGKSVAAKDLFRLQEATLSFHILGHEISGGKSDAWLGPGYGGSLAWTNNAEDMYTFRINRVDPLHIPLLSRFIGPMRYDFFVGSLKGHTVPNAPWAHSEMFSFAPTGNFQFGFQRTVIWGGHGHPCQLANGTFVACNQPINLHTFLKSFFDINDTTGSEKFSINDPGARFSAFSFSYRLPFVRHYLTLYVDSIAHDDVTPPSAPRRAAYRPGLYLAQFPHIPKLDLRVEAASTDTSTLRSINGQFNYYEAVQQQGYTNKGFIMGDWIGREAKGGQAWLTYHLSADESIQVEYLNKKTPKDFIPGGTTQNQLKVEVLKNLPHNISMDAWFQYESWKAPIYKSGQQSDAVIAAQFTWRPKLHTQPTPAR